MLKVPDKLTHFLPRRVVLFILKNIINLYVYRAFDNLRNLTKDINNFDKKFALIRLI